MNRLKEEDKDLFCEGIIDTYVDSMHGEFIIDMGGAVQHLDTMTDELMKDEEAIKDFYEGKD